MKIHTFLQHTGLVWLIFFAPVLYAADYHVGDGQEYAAIGDVTWEALQPGDTVFIHHKSEPYREKWVIGRSGTELEPIRVSGVPGPNGELPVVTGENATTPTALKYTNQERGLIKIGSSSVPKDTLPQYIIIENLDLRSVRPAYSFTDDSGGNKTYSSNAAAVYVEKARHLTIRNCIIHDAGNGIFVGAFNGDTRDILIEKNHIYDNGIVGSYYQHNTYTAAIGITYQYNHMGPLRSGAGGNNLKDRSAGLTVRYNWIENGNRQLDLVDAEDSQNLVNHQSYDRTYVYGNVLLEADGEGNSQMVHYGGDSSTTDDYRKGNLYFFNNTLVSTRTGNTTMIRLSTNDETANVFNNIVHVTATGSRLALASDNGRLVVHNNWFSSGYRLSHGSFDPSRLTDAKTSILGSDPGFVDLAGDDYRLLANSPARDAGMNSFNGLSVSLPLEQYQRHISSEERPSDGTFDIGAFEYPTHPEPMGLVGVMAALEVAAGKDPSAVLAVTDVDGDQRIGLAEAVHGLRDVKGGSFSPVTLQSSVTTVQPMTGIVLWDDSEHNQTDSIQLEYRYVGYDQLVMGEGQYNWTVLENLLDTVAARGHQAIVRFYFVYPGAPTTVPQYLKDLPGYSETSGVTEGKITWFPDWSSSGLENFVLDFYEEFASRYNNDPRLAFLQVGFGLWGEYHIYEGPRLLGKTFPTKSYQATFFNHMAEQCTNLKWSISIDAADTETYSPFATSALLDLQFGLFDDSFNHKDHDDYNRDSFLFFDYAKRSMTSPIGGELSYYTANDQQNGLAPAGPNGVSFEARADQYHVSYMIGNDQPDYVTMARIKEAGMATGYRFSLTTLQRSATSVRGTVKNNGIAPIYYDTFVTVNGVRSHESLKGLAPGSFRAFYVDVVSGASPTVTIECDRLVAGQIIEYDADL